MGTEKVATKNVDRCVLSISLGFLEDSLAMFTKGSSNFS